MLAVPVFRSRVAPVLNWCCTVLLFPEDVQDGSAVEELALADTADPFERLRVLRKKGVTTLICGALSPDLLRYAEDLKLKVICGVAGGVSEVLKGYREHRLDQPFFRLPGCRCAARFSEAERRSAMPDKQGKGFGRGRGKGAGGSSGGAGRMGGGSAGPGGDCVCPGCGEPAPHERGKPCAQMACPKCGRKMTRR